MDGVMIKNIYDKLIDRLINSGFGDNDTVDAIVELPPNEIQKLYDLDDESLSDAVGYFKKSNRDFIYYDVRFMRIAREFSLWSKDPKKKVGCVIVRDRQIISQGYNGFPRGIKDDWRLHVKDIKLSMIVHAEMNAITNAVNNNTNLIGSTVYVYGLPACSDCIKSLIQTGISRVVMCDVTRGNSKSWSIESNTFKNTISMLDECEIDFSFMDVNSLELPK